MMRRIESFTGDQHAATRPAIMTVPSPLPADIGHVAAAF